jgi:PTH1 family peptidyl-tRNA hydrolase
MADTSPWLVVGLGNPGPKYAKNRHNVGFMVVDDLADQVVPSATFRDQFKGQFASITEPPGERSCGRHLLLKPQTYMNRSGESVAAAAAYNRTPVDRIIVVHDEIDFDFGRVAIKVGGGHGGHNGLRDIEQKLSSRSFIRVRLGVGRPVHGEVSDWVLSNFAGEDASFVPDMIERARRATRCVMAEGLAPAMNQFNAAPT